MNASAARCRRSRSIAARSLRSTVVSTTFSRISSRIRLSRTDDELGVRPSRPGRRCEVLPADSAPPPPDTLLTELRDVPPDDCDAVADDSVVPQSRDDNAFHNFYFLARSANLPEGLSILLALI